MFGSAALHSLAVLLLSICWSSGGMDGWMGCLGGECWSACEEKESESMANSSSCLQSKQMDRWSRSNDTVQLV